MTLQMFTYRLHCFCTLTINYFTDDITNVYLQVTRELTVKPRLMNVNLLHVSMASVRMESASSPVNVFQVKKYFIS